jgi:hypothetical protein
MWIKIKSKIVGIYKVVQIWPGLIVCKQVTVCPGHIWTTLYLQYQVLLGVGIHIRWCTAIQID